MRLLLSICLLLASVVAARAQSFSWPTPGALAFGETVQDSQAGGEVQRAEPSVRLGQALAARVTGDDGKAPTLWLTGVQPPRAHVGRLAQATAGVSFRGVARPTDDRRAIRAFRRVLLPPDIA